MRKPALNLFFECYLSRKAVIVHEIPVLNGNTQRFSITGASSSLHKRMYGWALNSSKMSMQIAPCTTWYFNARRAECSHRISLACLSLDSLNAKTGSVPEYILTFAYTPPEDPSDVLNNTHGCESRSVRLAAAHFFLAAIFASVSPLCLFFSYLDCKSELA